MRYHLRTLLILLAVGPPFLAWWCWPALERLIHPPAKFESVLLIEVNFDLPNASPRDAPTP
jgi:hypothetical protein